MHRIWDISFWPHSGPFKEREKRKGKRGKRGRVRMKKMDPIQERLCRLSVRVTSPWPRWPVLLGPTAVYRRMSKLWYHQRPSSCHVVYFYRDRLVLRLLGVLLQLQARRSRQCLQRGAGVCHHRHPATEAVSGCSSCWEKPVGRVYIRVSCWLLMLQAEMRERNKKQAVRSRTEHRTSYKHVGRVCTTSKPVALFPLSPSTELN